MNILIVYANPNPESLSGRVKNLISGMLKKKGFEVEIRDLYRMQFNPVLTAHEEKENAMGTIAPEIKKEQDYLKWADMVYFIYPIWWAGIPAILKGYFERVLTEGFAYTFNEKGLVKLMEGKKVVILNHHACQKSVYEGRMYDALEMTTDIGIFDFCGFEIVEHRFFPASLSASEEEKTTYLESIRQLCERLH